MKQSNLCLFMGLFFAWVSPSNLVAQTTEIEVEGFQLETPSSHFWLLAWKPVPSQAFGERVSYAVFRNHTEHFRRSAGKQLANAIAATTFIARVPGTSHAYNYQVIAVTESKEWVS
jgi:hypothetical protein